MMFEKFSDKIPLEKIGIFDSGVGGLSVLSEIRFLMPKETLFYLGDSARSPYGSKSVEKIKAMTLENSLALLNAGSKVVIIACNTASAIAKDYVETILGKKVIGVVDAGVRTGVELTKNKRIGVIGTTQTILSKAHELAINKLDSDIKVFNKATPLFATIVEENFINRESTALLIEEELNYFKEKEIDTLILGCTHYPFLKNAINKFFNNKVNLVDPAKETAREVFDYLYSNNLLNKQSEGATTHIFTTDSTETFAKTARNLLNNPFFTAKVIEVSSLEFDNNKYNKLVNITESLIETEKNSSKSEALYE